MAEGRVRRMELNQALEAVGELGPFQYLIFACLFVVGAFHGARMTSGYYFLYEQEHHCYVPPPNPNASFWSHHSNDSRLPGECYVYNNNNNTDSTNSQSSRVITTHYAGHADDQKGIPCPHGWVYSESVMEWTATAEFDMVCDKKLYPSHANTALMVGSLLGSIVFGQISDRFGRKVCFHTALLLFVAFGVGLPFSTNFYIFVVTYGLSGAASTGLFAASLVTAMEYVLPAHRKVPALLINVFFPIGEMVMTGIAYRTRDWRSIALAISAPAALMFVYYWIVPESIRWLMLHRKYTKLDKVLRRMAKLNRRGVPLEADEDDEGFAQLLQSNEFQQGAEQRDRRQDSFLDMFKHCTLALRVLCTSYNWLVVNLAYFGLVYYSTDLGQGLFMNFFLGAVVEAPAHIMSLCLVDRIGRKRVHCFYFLLVAVATGISIIICFEVEGKKWILLLMTMVGKFGAAGLTGTSFLWMTEQFPTSVRSTGLGVGAASARVGAILSSYVIDFGDHMGSTLGKSLPYMVFCITSVLAFVACLFMPETSKKALPSTIEEARHFGRNPERQQADDHGEVARANYGSTAYRPLQASVM